MSDRTGPWWDGRFSSDEDGWDVDGESGGLGAAQFARAIQVWSVLQRGRTTVAAAAATFNSPASAVVEAIRLHPWMFLETEEGVILPAGVPDDLSKTFIGHEGE